MSKLRQLVVVLTLLGMLSVVPVVYADTGKSGGVTAYGNAACSIFGALLPQLCRAP